MSLEHVLELDLSCVGISGRSLRIRLGDDWVKVEKPVAGLLREVVTQVGNARELRFFPEGFMAPVSRSAAFSIIWKRHQ